MRDQRFVAKHRGGTLTPEEHRQLAQWAIDCVRHGIAVLKTPILDVTITNAISTAQAWINGTATVGEARNAAKVVHATARESENLTAKNLARAAGHAVATAHMADHSPGAAGYVLKACKTVGGNELVEQELAWQQAHLPEEICERVLSAYPRVLRMLN